MKRYNRFSKCVKCGSKGKAATQFVPAGSYAWISGKGQISFGLDVMERKCSICGYSWVELTADFVEGEDQQ